MLSSRGSHSGLALARSPGLVSLSCPFNRSTLSPQVLPTNAPPGWCAPPPTWHIPLSPVTFANLPPRTGSRPDLWRQSEVLPPLPFPGPVFIPLHEAATLPLRGREPWGHSLGVPGAPHAAQTRSLEGGVFYEWMSFRFTPVSNICQPLWSPLGCLSCQPPPLPL